MVGVCYGGFMGFSEDLKWGFEVVKRVERCGRLFGGGKMMVGVKNKK